MRNHLIEKDREFQIENRFQSSKWSFCFVQLLNVLVEWLASMANVICGYYSQLFQFGNSTVSAVRKSRKDKLTYDNFNNILCIMHYLTHYIDKKYTAFVVPTQKEQRTYHEKL